MAKRPTVIDVARLANVGASTVSRYLRGVQVGKGAAERIAAAVKKLGYEPNEAARSMRGGQSRVIGIIVPKVTNVFFSEATQLIEEECRRRGCSVILLTHQDDAALQREHLGTLKRYRADGVIITAAPGSTSQGIMAILADVPMVVFDSFLSKEIDSVLLRNREAARSATEHLLRHQYKNVACVTAKPEIYSFQERIAGYKEAMAAKRLKDNVISAPDYEQLRFALGTAIRGKKRPDAILSLSDFATLNILMTFQELGLRPNQKLPMVGFDDFSFAPLMDPPLSVVRQPIETMVKYALNALFRRINGEGVDGVQSISLPGELILRRSCGCM